MIVMCHKPAQINNTCRASADTIYIATYNNAAFFDNFKNKSKNNFVDVFEKVLSAETQEMLYSKTKRDEIVANHGTYIIKYNPKITHLLL